MTELTERKSSAASGSLIVWIVVGLVALLLVYALSPLPVLWIFLQSSYVYDPDALRWMQWYLAPLEWLTERSTAVMHFYDWYLSPLEEI